MAELSARFVISKSCDWTTLFGRKNSAQAELHGVKSARIVLSNLPGPWIAQRAVCFTATPLTFVEDLKVVLRSFIGVDDDQSTEVRLLVSNAEFNSMSADGQRVFNDLQRAANVLVGSYEVYPLIAETAVHVVGRLTAIVKFAKLLNEMLRDKATESLQPVGRQLVVARYPSAHTAATRSFGVPVRHVGRVKSSRYINYFPRPVRPIVVEQTSQVVKGPAVVRPLSALTRNQAMQKSFLEAHTCRRLS